jgi:methionyl-tRNA formyltransferase
MRLAFLGTPDEAVVVLRALLEAGHDIDVVITRPDRRRGRGALVSPSPVKHAAELLGLRVAHRLADLESTNAERAVVVAYGALIPAARLDALAMLNVHFSLLPRWRGAAPVERAILAGDDVTGVSVMTLEAGLDTGPVHLAKSTVVGQKTASELRGELARLGAAAMVEVLGSADLLAHPEAQHGDATYAEKLTAETFHLAPGMSVTQLERVVRLERAYTAIAGRRVLVGRAHATPGVSGEAGSLALAGDEVMLLAVDGALVLDEVRPEGARAMSAREWWRGARLDVGARWA